jgi:outer membrane protein assembly factor BamB
VSNRGEVVCLDTQGFLDDANDGPFKDEKAEGPHDADVVWSVDMMAKLRVRQHNMANCSPTLADGVLFVCTSNGVDRSHERVPAPLASSFIALDAASGQLLWSNNSPGQNILHGQWSSPAYALLRGVPQVIFAGGDGWLYSFHAEGGGTGRSRLLWRFDCNAKASVWRSNGEGTRNNVIATPVIHDGLVYIATGQDPEKSPGVGDLWCIDPTLRIDGSDISPELVVGRDGEPVTARREQALDRDRLCCYTQYAVGDRRA